MEPGFEQYNLDDNHITKDMALSFMRDNCRNNRNEIVDKIVRTTIYGEEYASDKNEGYQMSYYCRAFNITALNVSKQRNRIKNRYKKYANNPMLAQYMRQILLKNWPGFKTESPRMDDLLADYARGGASQEIQKTPKMGNASDLKRKNKNFESLTLKKPKRRTASNLKRAGKKIGSRRKNSNFAGDDLDFTASESEQLRKILKVLPLIVVIILVLIIWGLWAVGQKVGGASGFFDSVGIGFRQVMLLAVTAVALILGVGVPLVGAVKSKIWRDIGRLVWACVLWMIGLAVLSNSLGGDFTLPVKIVGSVFGILLFVWSIDLFWENG